MRKIFRSTVSLSIDAQKLFTLLFLSLLSWSLLTSGSPMNWVSAQGQESISVNPASIVDPAFSPGGDFTVTINVTDVLRLFQWEIVLCYDSSVIECAVAYLPVGHVFEGRGLVPQALEINNTEGFALFGTSLSRYSSETVDVDQGVLCAFNFQILDRGSCQLALDEVNSFLLDANLESIPATLVDGFFDNRLNGHISQDQATMFVHPASIVDLTLTPSSNFTITINVTDVTNLFTWQSKLLFDPSLMECTNAYYPLGHVFDGLTNIPVAPTIDNVTGYVLHGCTLLLDSVDVDQGVLCAFEFHVLDTGSCDLALDQEDSFLLDGDLVDIPTALIDGFFENREAVEVHDVAITDVTAFPPSVTVGDSVFINVTVENQGDFTETFDVTAYYDTNAIDTATTSLNSGESDSLVFIWDTTGVDVETYTISANATIVAGEEDTADNSFVDAAVEVVEPPPPHDIAITDVTPSKTSVPVGDSVTIDVTVENQGTEAETFNVTTYYDGMIIDTFEDISLDSGQSTMLQFTWNTTGVALGTYTISANATTVEGEEYTADNSLTDGTVEIVEAPPPHDIAITDITPSQTSAVVGESVSIDVTVENQGTEAETFNVSTYYDGNVIDTMTDVPLNAGESDLLTFTWDTTGVSLGTYIISANATVVAGEEDVADNSYVDGEVEIVETLPTPALWIEPPTLVLTSEDVGKRFNVTVWVNMNDPSYTWQIKVLFNTTYFQATRTDYTGEGKSEFFAGHPTVPVSPIIDNEIGYVMHGEVLLGEANVTGYGSLCWIEFELVTARLENLTIDFSRYDTFVLNPNLGDIRIETMSGTEIQILTSPHDVGITEVTPSKTLVVSGRTVTIDVTVENQGTEPETFNVTTYYDGVIIDTIADIFLDAGQSTMLQFTWNTTGVALGTYTISANATTVEGEEYTEDNSYINGEVEIVETPIHDVAVIDVTPSQSDVRVNSSITIDVTVENQGTEPETFNVTTHYDGVTIDTMTGVSLNAGESDVLTFTWDTTGVALGTYTIGANVTTVPGEEDTGDNLYINGEVEVTEVPPPSISSCDSGGMEKDKFMPGEHVYASGENFDEEESVIIYVVLNGGPYTSEASIYSVPAQADVSGILSPVDLGAFGLGEYDIWIDRNGNNVLDEEIEPVDAFGATAGFFVIPEYFIGTILGLAGCFAALGAFRILKKRR